MIDLSFDKNEDKFSINFEENKTKYDAKFENLKMIKGATFYPHVSNEGVLSWTNDGYLENPLPVNIKGEKGEKGELGEKGKDGYTPIKGVDYFDGKNGINGKDGYTPIKGIDYFDGKNGANGKDGVSITKVEQTKTSTEPGGENEVTATLSNGQTSKFKVYNGAKGENGKDGVDGHTPIKGTDYFTEADKAELVASVKAQLVTEQWTFTLMDDTTVTKEVIVE